MSDNWWPAPLSHIPEENPWEEDDIVVAEIRSFDEQPHAGHRRTFSVLVPAGEIDEIRKNLAGLDYKVSASGPNPSPFPGSAYNPNFWVSARDLPQEKYEPLVLSWTSHDKTIFQVDPKIPDDLRARATNSWRFGVLGRASRTHVRFGKGKCPVDMAFSTRNTRVGDDRPRLFAGLPDTQEHGAGASVLGN